jgi:predicted ester cyclase
LVDEALNRGILDVLDEVLGEFAEEVKAVVQAWRAAFPDFHTTIVAIVAEDDWVAFHLRHQGTQEGEFLGFPPTGRDVDFRTMIFNRCSDGIVVENWGLHDHASVLARLRSEA